MSAESTVPTCPNTETHDRDIHHRRLSHPDGADRGTVGGSPTRRFGDPRDQCPHGANPTLDPLDIEDVVWGAANQAGEDNRNVARMAVLLAGLGIEVPGQSVNRLCGSGLQAVIKPLRPWPRGGEM